MKKLINNMDDMVHEMMKGYVYANDEILALIPGVQGIMLKDQKKDKVKIVISGGSGVEPLYPGYVGENMADAACPGDLFAAPSAYTIYEAVKYIGAEKGVVFIYGNYAGDFLNNDMASELLELDGIKSKSILTKDDILSASKQNKDDRSGITGIVFAVKIAGAAAALGYDFDEVIRITQKAADNTFTVPVVAQSGTMPSGELICNVAEDEVIFGMGFNGEPGVRTEKNISANKMMDIAVDFLIEETELKKGERIAVLLNNMGASTFMEMHILCNRMYERFNDIGIDIHHTQVGTYFTAQEMKGFSISVIKLDEELCRLYDHKAVTPVYYKSKGV